MTLYFNYLFCQKYNISIFLDICYYFYIMKTLTKSKDESLEKIYYLTKCFHFSTNLPIRVICREEIMQSFPSSIITAYDLLKTKKKFPIYTKEDTKLQIIINKYKEQYLVLNNVEEIYTIIVGPTVNEQIELGTITNMIRESIIPFHQKSTMQEYYENCELLNKEKLYYVGKFIEHLYKNEIKEFKTDTSENIDDTKENNFSYYKQKGEYRNNDFIHSPYFIEQEICKTISNGDIDGAKKILKEINLTPHAKLASNSLRSYKNSMICSCAFMTRAAIAGGVNPDNAFTLSDTFINNIENFSTIEELDMFERKMVEGFAKQVKEIKTNAYSPAVLNTIHYIDNHLCENIEINDLAKAVYLNSSYLSSIFHKETGKTISNWITTKRIEEASHFVLNTNDDIADIALFYNFCSQSYFVQCFKKIMGVTPGEYRRNANSTYIK